MSFFTKHKIFSLLQMTPLWTLALPLHHIWLMKAAQTNLQTIVLKNLLSRNEYLSKTQNSNHSAACRINKTLTPIGITFFRWTVIKYAIPGLLLSPVEHTYKVRLIPIYQPCQEREVYPYELSNKWRHAFK